LSKKSKPAPGGTCSPTPTAPAPPSSPRAVVSLALALFVPALFLVLNGNLSVQTALVRFLGALVVSWFAAGLVISTVRNSTARNSTESTAPGGGVGATPSPAETAGATRPEDPDAAGRTNNPHSQVGA
jgi:hypothetical protein